MNDQRKSTGLTVRKLRSILDGLPPDILVVLQGTEWNMPAGDARMRDWTATHQDGRPKGPTKRVLFLELEQ